MFVDRQLSPHFKLSEFIYSYDATRQGFTEQFDPPQHVIDNIQIFVDKVLEPLRCLPEFSNGYFKISSGWRTLRLNQYEKSVSNGPNVSQHMYIDDNCAADVEYFENGVMNNWKLYDVAKAHEKEIHHDQMIKEFSTATNNGWIHISYKINHTEREMDFTIS